MTIISEAIGKKMEVSSYDVTDAHKDCPPLCAVTWNPQKTGIPVCCSLYWKLARLSGPFPVHRRVSERTADLTLHGNTKAILRGCCCFPTLSLTYKTEMYNHTNQPRTLPPTHCLCKSFSPSCWSWGHLAERVAVLFTMCVALIPRSVSVSVLDSLFLSPFLSPPPSFSVPAPARPFLLSSILLFPRHSQCYSEMCLHRTHTPRALDAGEEDVLPRNFPPDSSAVLHISHEQKAIFFPAHCLREVVQAMNEMTLSVCVLTDEKMIIKGDDGKL